tara:strand:- start:228 stop:611 length:384 start_codon:yes stop_codon:yes gene_type:complete
MRKIATLTKMTDQGLSTWTFVQCDKTFVAFGGCTNRCKVFDTLTQLQDCMLNFASYGYTVERHTQSQKAGVRKSPKPVKRIQVAKPEQIQHQKPVLTSEPVLEADEDPTAPRPQADVLVAPADGDWF